ncbi:MAG: hypothetical protein CMP95_06585 [Gammaproteobacteria bacterium]|nr:hypothetical protein [Gammaproteobacteria bacterium]
MLLLIGNAIEVGLAYLFGNEGGYSGRMYNYYWAVPITTSEKALLSANQATFTVWRCSNRFGCIAFKEFCPDRSHGSRVR